MSTSLEERLTELETRIAFLDQTVQSLDATVAAQDRRLLELQREIAQFRGEKDHKTLVKAFAFAAKQVPDSILVLAGEDKNGQMDKIKQIVKSEGVESKVLFIGYHKDIGQILPAADLFVLSSIIEPFGKVIIEAFAANIPVVSTDVEGPLEIIRHGENGLLCKVGNAQSMAEQALRFHAEPALAKRCVAEARKYLPEVDFDHGMQKLVDHYRVMAKKMLRGTVSDENSEAA